MRKKTAAWYQRLLQNSRSLLRWLIPGIGVKRWILVILAGTTLIGVGLAVLVLDIYRTAPETWWLPLISAISLRFLDRPLRVIIFGGLGLGIILLGIMGLNRSLLKPFLRQGKPIFDTVADYHRRERGPKLVAIGGGTGLSALLRGIKSLTSRITAIVTVADDGGSSGALRRNMGVLPPGDIRNCLTALSDDEELMTQIFQYRFSEGDGLSGHTLGNLLITALTNITGSFEEAVAESRRVLAVEGQVLPATLHDVRLVADVTMPETHDTVRVKGESKITLAAGKIERVWLEPNNPLAFPPSLQAILSAELIVIGPGSLYTSILPNLLVPDIAEALRVSRAMKFYICNLATQPGETDEYTCGEHIRTLEKHLGGHLFNVVICNSNFEGKLPQGVDWVKPEANLQDEYPIYLADLIDRESPWHHDTHKLAATVMDLYLEHTGPLTSKEEVI